MVQLHADQVQDSKTNTQNKKKQLGNSVKDVQAVNERGEEENNNS